MARPYVSLTDPPGGGQLESWGLDLGGEWWALIVWSEWVHLPGETTGHHPHSCAAWTLGRCVQLTGEAVSYLHVARIRLAAEPAQWPGPTNRPGAVWPADGWYLGVLRHGEQPQLPAGVRRVDGQGSAYG
jgi:hypothetical protein